MQISVIQDVTWCLPACLPTCYTIRNSCTGLHNQCTAHDFGLHPRHHSRCVSTCTDLDSVVLAASWGLCNTYLMCMHTHSKLLGRGDGCMLQSECCTLQMLNRWDPPNEVKPQLGGVYLGTSLLCCMGAAQHSTCMCSTCMGACCTIMQPPAVSINMRACRYIIARY